MQKRTLFKAILATSAALVIGGVLTGCGDDKAPAKAAATEAKVTVVKVGVVGAYNAQWDEVNKILAPKHIKVELVKFSDYATPNRALNDGEIDLNAFQHKAFLANDIKQKHYEIEAIGDTIIAPLAIYNNKTKIKSLKDLKQGDTIAIPSDLTNGGRALKLLEAAGLIKVNPEKGFIPNKTDITENPLGLKIMEAESGVLANVLPDVAAALINGGNAFTAKLDPTKDAIFVENTDPNVNKAVANLVNVIVARKKDKDNPTYKAVVDAYHTKEVANVIYTVYNGAYQCAWEGAPKAPTK
ncbi:MAG: MetQ/NlpA family ABC transporter substrate-binding protein [Sutterella sp.]|nr:MetQ/NlpA family ABC transporter substrate-binding protein [Sutterella sp.]